MIPEMPRGNLKCVGCGGPFSYPSDKEVRKNTGVGNAKILRCCAKCNTLQHERDGVLVRLTPAEELAYRVENPMLFEGIDSRRFVALAKAVGHPMILEEPE